MSQQTVYVCIRRCTWDKKTWNEGDKTHPLSQDIKPPHHFVSESKYKQKEFEDEEEEPNTLFEFTKKDQENKNTETGILASNDLNSKNFNALKKIARDRNIDCDNLNTKEQLIKAIQEAV